MLQIDANDLHGVDIGHPLISGVASLAPYPQLYDTLGTGDDAPPPPRPPSPPPAGPPPGIPDLLTVIPHATAEGVRTYKTMILSVRVLLQSLQKVTWNYLWPPPGAYIVFLSLYCAFQCCAQRAMQLKEEMVQLVGYNRFLRTRDDLEVANWMRAMRGEEPVPQVGFFFYSIVLLLWGSHLGPLRCNLLILLSLQSTPKRPAEDLDSEEAEGSTSTSSPVFKTARGPPPRGERPPPIATIKPEPRVIGTAWELEGEVSASLGPPLSLYCTVLVDC